MFILPQIVHNKLNVFCLVRSQTSYIKHLWGTGILYVPSQQIISADVKEICNSYQHIYRRHNVVIFPITDTLLFNAQFLRKLNLIQFS